MRKTGLYFILFFFLLNNILLTAQTPDLAVTCYVKDKQVLLRWATGKPGLFKLGAQYGYKIERVLLSDLKGPDDTSFSGKAVLINQIPLQPWKQTDERWNGLLRKNKNATLLLKALYDPIENKNKEMLFPLALKSCDLYADIARAAGLFAKDTNFIENETYVYRVSLWNAPKTTTYSPAYITIHTKEKTILPKLTPIKAKFLNKRAILTIATAHTENYFSGFLIERSEDSVNFSLVNKAPLIHSTTKFDAGKTTSVYTDSLPENNKVFYYRVRGLSYFGELSEPSNIVYGKGKADFVEYPKIDSVIIVKNRSVCLKFSMPRKFDTNELKGYLILRSEKRNTGYEYITPTLLTKETTGFTDEKPLTGNYYKICAININNDSSFSLTAYAKLIDDIPPEIPIGLTGKMDTSGVATLTWNVNMEKDLKGYRVFRCNSEKEQPVEITTNILTTPYFTDKVNLQTLTREIYYTIRAVDKVYNNSGYSHFCKLIRPDKIAPVSPVFKQVIYTDSSIQLNWLLSTSTDVATYKLLTSTQPEGGWSLIKEWAAKDSIKNFTDPSVVPGIRYRYKLEAYDDSKNLSAVVSQFISFQPAFAPKIKTWTANVNTSKRNITVNWIKHPNAYNYTIYKAKANEELRAFKTIPGNAGSYTDTELYPNNTYRYTIKATFTSGIETKMSDVIIVNF
jgi:hypothetical protein